MIFSERTESVAPCVGSQLNALLEYFPFPNPHIAHSHTQRTSDLRNRML